MPDLNDMFGEFLKGNKEPKSFGDLVSSAIDRIPEMQQMLRDMEKALLAMKADNSCENNIPLMTAAIEFNSAGPAFMQSIEKVAIAHHIMHKHGGDDAEVVEIDGANLPPEIQEALKSVIGHLMRKSIRRNKGRDFDGNFS